MVEMVCVCQWQPETRRKETIVWFDAHVLESEIEPGIDQNSCCITATQAEDLQSKMAEQRTKGCE